MEALVQEIYGVWKFHRPAGMVSTARSTPGHLIHFVDDGAYRLTTDNRTYELGPGDLVYYFESEEVHWRGHETPVTFFSIGFEAPRLDPPDTTARVLRDRSDLKSRFVRALAAVDDGPSIAGRLGLFRMVLEIVAAFHAGGSAKLADDASLWWQLENEIKRRRLFRANLPVLCELAGYSRATVIRACKQSTGCTPIARLRELRMQEAKGLLHYSMASISEVAQTLGYGRVHEFSRDFSKTFQMPPSAFRKEVSPVLCNAGGVVGQRLSGDQRQRATTVSSQNPTD